MLVYNFHSQTDIMELCKPRIRIGEKYAARWDCGVHYDLTATLLRRADEMSSSSRVAKYTKTEKSFTDELPQWVSNECCLGCHNCRMTARGTRPNWSSPTMRPASPSSRCDRAVKTRSSGRDTLA